MSTVARTAAPPSAQEGRGRPWFAHRPSSWYPLAWTPLLLLAPLVAAVQQADVPQVAVLLALAALQAAIVLLRHRAGAGPRTEVLVAVLTLLVAGHHALWNAHQVFLYPLLALAMAAGIRPQRALGFVGALAVSGAFAAGFSTGSLSWALVLAVLTYMAGFSAHLISCLVGTVGELAATRKRLARAAVAEERERFSRDLHDLLGHSLSVIVVKAEAARRFAPTDPDAAAEHARGIEDIGRSALGQVREAVDGYREASLRDELEAARSALRDAGVQVEIRGAEVQLPPALDTLFAWVIREGSTNVIRHARARHCTLLVEVLGGEATVEITDDGAPDGHRWTGGAARPGAGLVGLRERAERLGGVLVAGAEEPGFRLGVSVPLPGGGSRS